MMPPSPETRARLQSFGERSDDDIPLVETALLLSQSDRPGSDIAPYHRHLDALIADVERYANATDKPLKSATGRVEALVQVLCRHHGYFGADDVFDDIEGASLMRTIDRRSGLPVVLCIIYCHVAEHLNWQLQAIDFPGRVLLRFDADGDRVIFDPFDSGAVLDVPALRALLKSFAGQEAELTPDRFRAMSNRRLLIRLIENIKIRALRAGHMEDALTAIETMLLFAPGHSQLWREAGVLHARLDHLTEAVDALEQFLEFNTLDQTRYAATALLQELRRRLPS